MHSSSARWAASGVTAPLVLATRNAGKVRELRAFFSTHAMAVEDLASAGLGEDVAAEDAIEVFETFEANARAKARYFASRLPGRIVVADDSGLAVQALNGAPGVRSRRWSERLDLAGSGLDAANNARLLASLRGVTDRRARFVCVAAWCNGRQDVVALGEVEGRIIDEPRGTHGFGYDPHFHVEELGLTLAEATIAEKERVSHRGRAFRRLLELVRGRCARG